MLPTAGQGAQALAFFLCGMRMALLYAVMGFARPRRRAWITALSDVAFCLLALVMFICTSLHICDGEIFFYTFLCVFAGFLLQYITLWPIIKSVRKSIVKAADARAARRAQKAQHESKSTQS